jgi:hypothetical protein
MSDHHHNQHSDEGSEPPYPDCHSIIARASLYADEGHGTHDKRDSFLTIIGLRAVSEAVLMFPDVFFYMLTGCKSLKVPKVAQQRRGCGDVMPKKQIGHSTTLTNSHKWTTAVWTPQSRRLSRRGLKRTASAKPRVSSSPLTRGSIPSARCNKGLALNAPKAWIPAFAGMANLVDWTR